MPRRHLMMILTAAAAVALAVYLMSGLQRDTPGQPSPHAIDQSP